MKDTIAQIIANELKINLVVIITFYFLEIRNLNISSKLQTIAPITPPTGTVHQICDIFSESYTMESIKSTNRQKTSMISHGKMYVLFISFFIFYLL